MSDSPSFLRGLFVGRIHDALVFPYPPTLEERDPAEARVVARLLGALRDMGDAGLIDSARFDEEETIPEETIRALAAHGFLGLTIPRKYGGLGLSSTAYARVFGAVAATDASLGVFVGVHCGLGSKAVVLFGSNEQKARYLPALARGETLAAYALTEPETGSDAQHIVTRADPAPDGDGWRINGRKHWIGLGHRAGVIVVFAQAPTTGKDGKPTRRPTAFIVRPDMPGFEVVGTVRKLGIRGSTQAELLFTNTEVPADHVLGQVGKGFNIAVQVLNGGRLSLAAGCTQSAKALVGEMVRYAEWRVQFGAPLASFEITQRKLSSLAADAYGADAMLGHLAAALDRKDVDASLEAAAAKVFASDLVWRAADEMVQVAGGRGYVKPYPYERMLRDARINRIFEGANEVLKLFIALNGVEATAGELKELGHALRRPISEWNRIAGYAALRVRTALGGVADGVDVALHERLQVHKRFLEKHVGQLRSAAERAALTHRKRIIERQLIVERLANMAIELYARTATIARTQRLIDERGADAVGRELALCDLFCFESGQRFRMNRELLGGRAEVVDDIRRGIAADIRAERGYVVPDAIFADASDTEPKDTPSAAPVHEDEGMRSAASA